MNLSNRVVQEEYFAISRKLQKSESKALSKKEIQIIQEYLDFGNLISSQVKVTLLDLGYIIVQPENISQQSITRDLEAHKNGVILKIAQFFRQQTSHTKESNCKCFVGYNKTQKVMEMLSSEKENLMQILHPILEDFLGTYKKTIRHVLDLGCGYGKVSEAFSNYCWDVSMVDPMYVTAIDHNINCLKEAEKKFRLKNGANIRYQLVEADMLEFVRKMVFGQLPNHYFSSKIYPNIVLLSQAILDNDRLSEMLDLLEHTTTHFLIAINETNESQVYGLKKRNDGINTASLIRQRSKQKKLKYKQFFFESRIHFPKLTEEVCVFIENLEYCNFRHCYATASDEAQYIKALLDFIISYPTEALKKSVRKNILNKLEALFKKNEGHFLILQHEVVLAKLKST